MKTYSLKKGLAALWYPFIFGFYLFCTPALARNTLYSPLSQQQTQISGIVTDAALPLSGVSISVKNQKNITVTDFDGKFVITVSANDILIFTYIGYKTIEIPVAKRLMINVQMQEDTTTLQEVKINAGYYSVKESERTGSIAKITAKDIDKQPVTNILSAMQGRMAGVTITQTTGTPGGGFDVQIRGTNSLRADGNQPLYIINGVPYASNSISNNNISSIIIPSSNVSPLSTINPSDIESIEVLKDADATAIYGSRGANGVILINTKKGKEGKTRFTINTNTAVGNVTRYMDLMHTDQYLEMRKEAFANDGIVKYPVAAYDINGTWDQSRYTDWQKELIGGTAQINDGQISINSGSAQTQFLLSGNYHNETTVFPGDYKYKRGGANFNLNHQSADNKFKINLSASYSSQNNNLPATDFTREARSLSPNAPSLYDAFGNLNWENGTFNNPLRNLEAVYKANTANLIANTILSYQIIPELEIKTNIGFSNLHYDETRTSPSTIYNPSLGLGSESSSLFVNNSKRESWIIEPQLNWNKKIGHGKIEFLAGATFQQQKTAQLVQEADGFASNSLIYDLASATYLYVFTNQQTQYKYQAFFGRVNFNWKDRYILNFTGRRDGSSRFGPGNQFANFGAIGAAWLFSKEPSLENKILSFGKLRASYGTTGNDQIGDYNFLDTYSSAGNNYQGTVGLQPNRLYNANFGWETNKKMEIALELGFIQDRIFLTTAYYRNRSSNQLVGVPLPGTTGFNSILANLNATVENTGLELTIRTVNIEKQNFKWTTNLNLTVPKNNLIAFPQLENSTYVNQYVIGKSINIQKVYNYIGLNTQTGIYQFEDVNKDGKISSPDDRQTVKDFSPKYYGGLQNQFNIKRWQLDFLFQYVKQENWNSISMLGMPGGMSNKTTEALNRWQNPGDTGPYQMYSSGTNSLVTAANNLYTNSNAAISDASYLRLKNISISYNLPENSLKNLKCRISLQGQNILTFTSYKGADPEFIVSGFLPPLKIYALGLQLIF
ncbi:SusC/RagA family TonB-linked outer membrane protein [Flavobacterium sp. 2]|uniref:SusC/RagA family TonB-linked outer membrane protein n=1 Tax=Flavobacterium sp. 2 TaxID=308053 RepID=UPI000C18E884|nr:SusC/RagA family TonB-linked outer membrane protein [Flavobacterium sp. 2]PIF60035.1 TonB-linked SusC/RagA family outer membrane protein [Flavobacterium sp. 2]